jgi:hypothetical protein
VGCNQPANEPFKSNGMRCSQLAADNSRIGRETRLGLLVTTLRAVSLQLRTGLDRFSLCDPMLLMLPLTMFLMLLLTMFLMLLLTTLFVRSRSDSVTPKQAVCYRK